MGKGGREGGGECRNGIISGVRCVCVRACVKAAAAAAAISGEVGKGAGWVRDKPKAGKQSEEEEKSLPSRAYASVDGSIRSPSPSRDRGFASHPLAFTLSLSRSLRERPIVFEFADRRSEIPEIRLLTPG